MVRMATKLRFVSSCLLVASLAGCSAGSQATSPPDAPTVTAGHGGSAGTGGGPGGVGGGGGGTGGQLSTATSATPPLCIPGASVACACVTGQTGAQTCTSAGTFAACVCATPAVDAGATGGSDGAVTSPLDAPVATGGSDARSATDGSSDVSIATGGTETGGTAGSAGTGGSAVSSSSGGAGGFGGTAGAGGGGGRPITDAAADQNTYVPAVPDAAPDASPAADAQPDGPSADAHPDVVALQGVFVPTGSMTVARTVHTATLLGNGKVLIAGGGCANGILATAELYDPATGTFAVTGSMTVPRTNHTATLLPNGQVLIAGGENVTVGAPAVPFASAELYDPATGTFTATGTMTVPRVSFTTTLLPNGKVLIEGG
jgi:hypothetical protein